MLVEIRNHVRADHSFAFETTLSGRVYAAWVPRWRSQGYRVKVIFLKLASVELARARVGARILQGGHDNSGDAPALIAAEGK
jgi:predicted ABC-type ATPase